MFQTYIACLGQGKNREKQLLISYVNMADEARAELFVFWSYNYGDQKYLQACNYCYWPELPHTRTRK